MWGIRCKESFPSLEGMHYLKQVLCEEKKERSGEIRGKNGSDFSAVKRYLVSDVSPLKSMNDIYYNFILASFPRSFPIKARNRRFQPAFFRTTVLICIWDSAEDSPVAEG